MRERIESVIKAPPEVQPQTLDTTSTEIAETVLSAEAALEKAKKVSARQASHSKSSAFDAAVSTMKRQLEPSFTAATLVSPTSPYKNHLSKDKSMSEMSTSTAGTGQTTWGRMAQLVSPKRRTKSTIQSSNDCVASLSSAWLPETQDLQDQLTTSSSLREQLEVARKETSEKGSLMSHRAGGSSSSRNRDTVLAVAERSRNGRSAACPNDDDDNDWLLG
ncbi:hypothetical protein IG631_13080 [Alternaria alternata]|nr:hypothetical protein IG631_13080 [Alternaria alternata]